MDYSKARPLIKSGDLLSFSHGNWRTWREIKTNFVRIFTRSTYSHVGIAWVVEGAWGRRVFVLEAVKPKLRIYPLSASGDFYWTPINAEWTPEGEEFALECVGVDYSESEAVRAYFEPLEEGNVRECAAYVREVWKRLGIDLGNRSTPDAILLAAQSRDGASTTFVSNGGYVA